ncbi:hypothetical protein Barb6_03661 [Bacteroidales bacterium Barb6]|nr:hypothetical protein Barb6_03661 [Bacteroidales bacterium Barb6]
MAEYDTLGFFFLCDFLAGRLDFRFLFLHCPFRYCFGAETLLGGGWLITGFSALFCQRVVFNDRAGGWFFCRAVGGFCCGNRVLTWTTSFLLYFGRLTVLSFFLVFFNLFSG